MTSVVHHLQTFLTHGNFYSVTIVQSDYYERDEDRSAVFHFEVHLLCNLKLVSIGAFLTMSALRTYVDMMNG